MAIVKSLEATNIACNSIVDLLDRSGNGSIAIYDSTNMIVQLSLSNPAFGDAVDGTAVANAIGDGIALSDGTAESFSFLDGDGTSIWGGEISYISQGGDMELDTTNISADSTVIITSAVYIVPR